MQAKLPIQYFVMIFVLAAIWGLSFSFIKVATVEFGSFALAFMRIFLAAIFLLSIITLKGQLKQQWHYITQLRSSCHFFIAGLIGQLLPFILYAKAELTISASMASILNATTPIWAAIVAMVWLKKRFQIIQLLGISLSFIGVIILVGNSAENTQTAFQASLIGSLAILLATFFYGFGSNYLKKYLNDIPPLHVATSSTIYASITGLPLAILFWPEAEISLQAWKATILLGFLCTGLAFVIFFKLISEYDATSAVSVTFLIPIFGVLSGIVLLSEQVSLIMIAAMLVILIGILLSSLKIGANQ